MLIYLVDSLQKQRRFMQQGVRGEDQKERTIGEIRREQEWRCREEGEGKGKERSDKEK
jgi:hypothetical protein